MSDIEPLTEDEIDEIKVFNEKWRREWFKKNIGGIIALAAQEEDLENSLIEMIGGNDGLRKSLINRLPKLGKRGGSTKWPKGRYQLLVINFALLNEEAVEKGRTDRSDYAFEVLSDEWGYRGTSRLRECLRVARIVLTENDLPDFAVPFLKKQNRKSSKI